MNGTAQREKEREQESEKHLPKRCVLNVSREPKNGDFHLFEKRKKYYTMYIYIHNYTHMYIYVYTRA